MTEAGQSEWDQPWMDYSHPTDPPEPRFTFQVIFKQTRKQFSLPARAFGKPKAVEEMEKSLLALAKAYATVEAANVKVKNNQKGKGRIPNHGPRPATTFDRRGRRRY